jgi:ATP-dependent DNA helicase RecQ
VTSSAARLSGARALAALQAQLLGQDPADASLFLEPPIARLAAAAPTAAPLDLGVLARHVLRFRAIDAADAWASLRVPATERWPDEATWRQIGVKAERDGDRWSLRARPWCPAWLDGGERWPVDAAAGAQPRRFLLPVAGDPCLAELGRTTYQSAAQRGAMRAALSMTSGSTLLVCLPTGEGKSFVFQTAARVGFGDGARGVTIVVTPTVALALDQEEAAGQVGFDDRRRAYVGGSENAAANREIWGRIARGDEDLFFASPEAVCGPLRGALARAAEAGRLRAIAIDEAHLVDSWGASFRPQFQLLSGLRRDLLRLAGDRPRPRTLLLSATLSARTIEVQRTLFGPEAGGDGGEFAVAAAARLRPEPEYWVSPVVTEDEQRQRVLEALLHLPRPAILYTTEVKRAQEWYCRLHGLGFRRIAGVTGDSGPAEREAAVQGWRAGEIDLVVGTSAFGLGIDNPHVRAVVHACVPETLDRFYQEVGRGGRDGGACVSLLVPTAHDIEVAESLNQDRLISVELGLQRWKAMFESRTAQEGDSFVVRVDVAPGRDARYIDMQSKRSTGWSEHTLTLMAQAGMISLEGVPPPNDGAPGQFQRVRILEPSHLRPETWAAALEPHRQAHEQSERENLRRMKAHLTGAACVADALVPLYTVPAAVCGTSIGVARACGGCPACRAAEAELHSHSAAEPQPTWPPTSQLRGAANELIDASGRLLVFYDPRTVDWRRVTRAVGRLAADGVRNLVLLGNVPVDEVAAQKEAGPVPLLVADRLVPNSLPRWPTFVVAASDQALSSATLAPRAREVGRVFFLSADTPDPSTPGELLSRRHAGRTLDAAAFLRRLSA